MGEKLKHSLNIGGKLNWEKLETESKYGKNLKHSPNNEGNLKKQSKYGGLSELS